MKKPAQYPNGLGRFFLSALLTALVPFCIVTFTSPEAWADDAPILARILESGSTNSIGYEAAIHPDGSVTVHTKSDALQEQFPSGTVNTKPLEAVLAQIGDVGRIVPVGGCMKSASFGTATRIAYAGSVSGDLQCVHVGNAETSTPSAENVRTLKQLVAQIQKTLAIDTRRRRL